MGNWFSSRDKEGPSQSGDFESVGPWRVNLKKRTKFKSSGLTTVDKVAHKQSLGEFEVDVTVNVQLRSNVIALDDREGRICVSLEVESVSCSTGPVCAARPGDVGDMAEQGSVIATHRTFCSSLDVRLETIPGINSGDVNVVPRKSSANPTWIEKTSFARRTTAGVTMGASPEVNIASTEKYTESRIELGKECWKHSLLKEGQYGFFWWCDMGSSKITPNLRWFVASWSWLRRKARLVKKDYSEPWMRLIEKDHQSNDVNFASDRYPYAIEWRFMPKLQGSEVTWVMEVQLRIQVVRIPKHSHSALTIVQEIPFSYKFDFHEPLVPGAHPQQRKRRRRYGIRSVPSRLFQYASRA